MSESRNKNIKQTNYESLIFVIINNHIIYDNSSFSVMFLMSVVNTAVRKHRF